MHTQYLLNLIKIDASLTSSVVKGTPLALFRESKVLHVPIYALISNLGTHLLASTY